jgi:ribosomal protein L23
MSKHLTDADVADIFGITVEKVRDLCRTGWPHMKVGRVYRFSQAHLAAIEQLCERKPAPQTPAQTWDRVKR